MKTVYRKIMDKMVHPALEKKLSLGRRTGSDRRKNEFDRRGNTYESAFHGENDRRKSGNRRQLGVHEPRQRWFKINKSQSRHFLHDL